MYIILDSNVYSADLTLGGVRFNSLYDYLRKSKSSLVIPRIIREEVICDYGRRLKGATKKVKDVWGEYKYLMLDGFIQPFNIPAIPDKQKELGSAFKQLSKKQGIKVQYLDEIKDIDFDELWLRGVRRIRPASNSGEELRDVLIWLLVLKFASQCGTKLAFITNDAGFWAGSELHPQIIEDIKKSSASIQVYRNLEDFNTKNALKSKSADPKNFKKLINIEMFLTLATERLSQSLAQANQGTLKDLQLKDWQVVAGTSYKISEDIDFSEWQVTLEALVRLERLDLPYVHLHVPNAVSDQSLIEPVGFTGFNNPLQTPHLISSMAPPNLWTSASLDLYEPATVLDWPETNSYASQLYSNLFGIKPAPTGSYINYSQAQKVELSFSIRASCRVLMRTQDGKLIESEIDAVKLEHLTPVDNQKS